MMKRVLLILLILATLAFAACEDDPLEGIFDIWEDETVEPSGSFDLYDSVPEPPATTEPPPTIELPPLPG